MTNETTDVEVEIDAEQNGSRKDVPEWYASESWEEATIDLTDFGWGIVTIRDPSMADIARADQIIAKAKKEMERDADSISANSTRVVAAELRQFIHAVDLGDGARGYDKAQPCPQRTAKFSAWEDWAMRFQGKPYRRLNAGIGVFLADAGVAKN